MAAPAAVAFAPISSSPSPAVGMVSTSAVASPAFAAGAPPHSTAEATAGSSPTRLLIRTRTRRGGGGSGVWQRFELRSRGHGVCGWGRCRECFLCVHQQRLAPGGACKRFAGERGRGKRREKRNESRDAGMRRGEMRVSHHKKRAFGNHGGSMGAPTPPRFHTAGRTVTDPSDWRDFLSSRSTPKSRLLSLRL